jgi:hypothetical protein
MKSVLLVIASIACLLFISSCSNDGPVSPGGGSYVTSSYPATLESMDASFNAVCGAGTRDLYALGPAILHYDGSHWGTIEPPFGSYGTFRMAMGFPDGALVVSDGQRTYLRKDAAWTDISDGERFANDMWGNAPDNLYAVSYDRVRHFDGVAWSPVTLPENTRGLLAISGRATGEVVVTGERGTVVRYDGAQWSTMEIDTLDTYRYVAVTSSGRIFTADYNAVFEVTGSTRHGILGGILQGPLLCTDGDVLYAVGSLAFDDSYFVIGRYQEDAWHNVALDHGEVRTLWAGGGNVIAGGWSNFLWRGTADGGSKETVCAQRGDLVCATSIDGAIFAAGQGAYRYENGEWTNLDKESTTRDVVWDIAGRNRYDIYAVGREMILHYDGSQWTWVNGGFGNYLNAVWVDNTGDVWVAGDDVHRLHGSTWAPAQIGDGNMRVYDMWGMDETMYAVGSRGRAAICKNGVWRQVQTGTDNALVAVWGFDENHVYAVEGDSNEIVYYNGSTWQPMVINEPNVGRPASIWCTGPNDLFVQDAEGPLVHYDGRTWQPLQRVFPEGMTSITGAGHELLAVGYRGSVSYRR